MSNRHRLKGQRRVNPDPAGIPGLPPRGASPNGQPPQQMELQLQPIAFVAAPHGGVNEPALGPSNLVVTIDRATMSDGQTLIALRAATSQGVQVYWFRPDGAESLGRSLIQQSRLVRSGISLPPGAPLPDVDLSDLDADETVALQCAAELRITDGDGETTHPCSNKEPGHAAHKVDLPGAHPLSGFRWGKAVEGDGYVATVPPES